MEEMEGSIQLTWSQFQTNNAHHFRQVQSSKDFTDVTLVTEDGGTIESHRIVLTAGSQFFQRIFGRMSESLMVMRTHHHPLVYLNGVKSQQLEHLLDFLYCGATSVPQDSVQTFLELASNLGVKGLISEAEERGDRETNLEKEIDNLNENVVLAEKNIKTELNISKDQGGRLKELMSIPGEKLSCAFCNFTVFDRKLMKKHKKFHMQTNPTKTMGKLRSQVWESFTRSEDGSTALCNLCEKTFKCPNGSTSNLATHIENQHSNQDIENKYNKLDLETQHMGSQHNKLDKIKMDRKRSKVWKTFTRTEDGSSASCDLCGKTFNCVSGSTSNLANHLRKKHEMLI